MMKVWEANMEEQNLEVEQLPWLVFSLNKGIYAINTQYVTSINVLTEEITPIPQSKPYFKGIIPFRGEVIPLISLRQLFDMPSLDEEYEEFKLMLDHRIEDHRHWVAELERSVKENKPFGLATDPHQCKFGKWYDSYESKNHAVNFHLNKIDEPHKALHAKAVEVQDCKRNCNECERSHCLQNSLKQAIEVLMPKIVGLIDETKSIFWHDNRQMVIVVEMANSHLGLIVDEIQCIEGLEKTVDYEDQLMIKQGDYITGIARIGEQQENILLLNGASFFRLANEAYV